MTDTRVFLKTFRGVEAVQARAQNLTVPQRFVLLQVDGKRDVSEILANSAELGDFAEVFQELESMGFVTRVSYGPGEPETPSAPDASTPRGTQLPLPPPAAAPRGAAPPRAPGRRPLVPSAPPDDALRKAARDVLYGALGPDADRQVLRLEKVKRNDELVSELERHVKFLAGMGRSMAAADLQGLLLEVELRATPSRS